MKTRLAIIITSLTGVIILGIGFLSIYFFSEKRKQRALTISFPEPIKEQGPAFDGMVVTFIVSKDHRVFYHEGRGAEMRVQIPVFGNSNEEPRDTLICDEVELAEIDWLGPSSVAQTIYRYMYNPEIINLIKKLDTEKIKTGIPDSLYKKKLARITNRDSAPIFLIKADSSAKYADVVKMIDELKFHRVSKFVVVDLSNCEKEALRTFSSVKHSS